mmetsp:Transcript_13257/g.19267  ORF Transcript_13257/g.19267 Transcript_13257/m.19267 type:complete len:107 (+) Transcript_13257:51-371(+)
MQKQVQKQEIFSCIRLIDTRLLLRMILHQLQADYASLCLPRAEAMATVMLRGAETGSQGENGSHSCNTRWPPAEIAWSDTSCSRANAYFKSSRGHVFFYVCQAPRS